MSHVDNPFESPVILSFCPGILGIERGLARAGVECRVAAYVEIEAYIIANLVTGMEAGLLAPTPIWTDAKTFDASPFRGKIHGLIGGYPCTPFSTAGLLNGENDPRHLYPYLAASIYTIKPFWCFFENVANHLNIGYKEVKRNLESMGYVVKEGIYSAEEVGAPQQRKRLFILAIDRAVANSYRNGHRAGINSLLGESRKVKRKAQGKNGQWSRNEPWNLSKTMSNTESFGVGSGRDQQAENNGSRQFLERTESWSNIDHSGETVSNPLCDNGAEIQTEDREPGVRQEFIGNGNSWGIEQWPAGMGEYQYDWEEPRTIEPGMGCTINGYNFREDILRSLGNSVVEQTAELAFRDLIRKHFDHV